MKFTIIIAIAFYCIPWYSNAQSYQDARNHPCLKCHSSQTYTFHNELMDTEEKRLMNPYYILDTVALAIGVHNQFDCTDCHAFEYESYPHASNLKLEPLGTCLDCHGGDESFASYQFEKIVEESEKSIHHQIYGENFTCAKCHSQHTYAATARTSDNVLDIVDYSNKMCLSCHNDMNRYQLVSGHENPKLVQIHDWLPNQELHFKHVRCIECHTEVIDSLMVSHNIQEKAKAVKNCVECHTTNSRLKASLYKYENLRKRSKNGNVNTVLSNESYVIGTHQSPLLKLLSIIIFLATLVGIATHIIFRILKK
ncbi:MAG: cytochrome c3 family protein [Bacteroidetes bacterium]|nr:cytochrome c3 family protein [Bacteroidota bacterium]